MMGGQGGSQEDMFAKLESMREVISEVNSQFKDPVRPIPSSTPLIYAHNNSHYHRKKRHSSASASPNSCHSTRRNGLSKNWLPMK